MPATEEKKGEEEPRLQFPEVIYDVSDEHINNMQVVKDMIQGMDKIDCNLMMLLKMAHTRHRILTDGIVDPKKAEWLIRGRVGTTKKRVARLCFLGAILKEEDKMVPNNNLQRLISTRSRGNGLV